MRTLFFSIALLISIPYFGYAQIALDKQKLDNYFDFLEANNKFMGSVAVSSNGEIIYTKSIGFADVEKQFKSNQNTKYRIGSITKSFTTVLIMKAVEDKKLRIDQTIETFFPKLKNAKKISIQLLLSHRSGIPNFTEFKDYLSWNTKPKTVKEMINLISKSGSDFEPDSKAVYSNSNFVLLTYILEKTYKKTYAELLQETIVKPIGLTQTSIFSKIETQNNDAKSYIYLGNWIEQPETDASIPLGAGAIRSTPTDLTKFADALFNGKLLNSESISLMKTIKDGYGCGLFQIPFFENIGYGHTGGIDSFSSIYTHFGEGNISFAITSNGTNYNFNNISIAILSSIFDKPYDLPKFDGLNLTTDDLKKYLGIYTSKDIDLKITISNEGTTLIAQGSNQSPFPLDPKTQDVFTFEQAGIVLEFNPTEKSMILKQGDSKFRFIKD